MCTAYICISQQQNALSLLCAGYCYCREHKLLVSGEFCTVWNAVSIHVVWTRLRCVCVWYVYLLSYAVVSLPQFGRRFCAIYWQTHRKIQRKMNGSYLIQTEHKIITHTKKLNRNSKHTHTKIHSMLLSYLLATTKPTTKNWLAMNTQLLRFVFFVVNVD